MFVLTDSTVGEQFLHDGDVCNLGAINLGNFVEGVRGAYTLDEERLRHVVRIATRALDNVVDMADFGVERVVKTALKNRRIGLGIFGLADLLCRLRLGYNTRAGRGLAERAMRVINEESDAESRRLCAEKGPFPNIELSIFAEPGRQRRNAATTTIAPTGTSSQIADASGGCEPHFALAFDMKNVLDGKTTLRHVNADFEEDLRAEIENEEVRERIVREVHRSGTLSTVPAEWGLPEWMRHVYVTAGDIAAEDHVLMQAALQRHVENSISKTCNLPYEATHDDVLKIYLMAHEHGLKGLTIYRSGSRNVQVLETIADGEARLARADAEMLSNTSKGSSTLSNRICPDCKSALHASEGCWSCPSCGYALCGR